MTPVDIGSRLELLVDDALLDRLAGSATLRLHQPIPRQVIGVTDDPWHCPYRYMTVFQDGDLYRMYYAIIDMRGGKAAKRERICYAQSRDGIHWEKPSLGLFEYEGSTDNNVIWIEDGRDRLGVSGFSPFRDANPNCRPEHRYKAVAEAGPKAKAALGGNGLLALASPDGIHWSMLSPDLIVRPGSELSGFDSQNLAFWDSVAGAYRLYRRATYREGPGGVMRDVLTCTSSDFLDWGQPTRLCYPGATPEQMYTNNVIPYFRAPHLLIGFPARYVERFWSEAMEDLPEVERRKALIRGAGSQPSPMDPTAAGGQRIGTALTDTLFMISRDGVTFKRWGEAFIRPGLRYKDNWFYPDNYQNWGIVTTASDIDGAPDELSFYVSEGGRRFNQSNICRRYTLRIDGFVSVNAGRDGGEALTRPLIFAGRDLVVNFSASAAGSVRVEMLDEQNRPLPGFTISDGVELLGDDLERRVRWNGGKDLSALAGVPVRLRFQLTDADLYSFRFC